MRPVGRRLATSALVTRQSTEEVPEISRNFFTTETVEKINSTVNGKLMDREDNNVNPLFGWKTGSRNEF